MIGLRQTSTVARLAPFFYAMSVQRLSQMSAAHINESLGYNPEAFNKRPALCQLAEKAVSIYYQSITVYRTHRSVEVSALLCVCV